MNVPVVVRVMMLIGELSVHVACLSPMERLMVVLWRGLLDNEMHVRLIEVVLVLVWFILVVHHRVVAFVYV